MKKHQRMEEPSRRRKARTEKRKERVWRREMGGERRTRMKSD